MATARELREEVNAIFASKWTSREGQVVPDTPDVKLGNDAITLDATVLYADLVDSTDLVANYKSLFAAEVYRAYLIVACRIIRDNGGEITAFDGDRVMAIFLGDLKSSNAAKTALRINWAVAQIINPGIKKVYPNTSFVLQQVVGIDTGPIVVARTGIRGSNDLVWVGAAANHAAKLCSLRETTYTSFITEAVYKKLNEGSKFGGDPRRPMWEKREWAEIGVTVYRSNWTWEI